MANRFVLAQFGRQIELVHLNEQDVPRLGGKFDRMPAQSRERWSVIKIFPYEESNQLEALVTLIGIDALKKLFDCYRPRLQ